MNEKTDLRALRGQIVYSESSNKLKICENGYLVYKANKIEEVQKKQYQHTRPILTPRFIPSCTDELMHKLKDIQAKYQIPVQSHLSENYGEIAWVQELCPKSEFYGDAYDQFGLFGRDSKTVMAHCVHSDENEIRRMKENGVFIAHCPESNTNLSSGVAPIRQYLEEGMHVGLGSDVD